MYNLAPVGKYFVQVCTTTPCMIRGSGKIVALEENRPVDESVITLMKMSVTGLIGVIGGYIGGSK